MLKDLLDEDSNILAFQNMFDIVSVDYESMKFMKWVFPGYENIDDKLPEETTIQRRMKNYLLKGKNPGCAKGYLILISFFPFVIIRKRRHYHERNIKYNFNNLKRDSLYTRLNYNCYSCQEFEKGQR